MKMTFIEPPNDLRLRYGKLSSIGALMPSLGIACIAAVLKKNQHEADLIDPTAEGLSPQELEASIRHLKTDLVGMPVFTATYATAQKWVRTIKAIRPDLKIVLGGPHCSAFPAETLNDIPADFLIQGEGEYPTLELLNRLNDAGDPASVESLVWRKNGSLVVNPKAKLIENIDDLPLADRSIFQLQNYHHSSEHRGQRVMHLMSSRGCPWACSFCTTQLTFGKRLRYHSPKRIFEEMKSLVTDHHADELFFYDDTLTADKKRIAELCRLILDQRLKIPWGCYTRVDCVSPEILKLMAQAGCYQINYGIESGVQRLLDLIHKGFTLEQARHAVKWTHEAGIETICNFMFALPGETRDESQRTLDFAKELNPTYAQFYLTLPYPGTPLYELAKQHGTILTKSFEDFNKTPWEFVHYVPYGRTEEELAKWIKDAYRKFYLRPGHLPRSLGALLKLPPRKILGMIVSGLKIIRNK